MNDEKRNALIEAYVDMLLESMDSRDLAQFFIDETTAYMDKLNDAELIAEVETYHPYLLNEVQ